MTSMQLPNPRPSVYSHIICAVASRAQHARTSGLESHPSWPRPLRDRGHQVNVQGARHTTCIRDDAGSAARGPGSPSAARTRPENPPVTYLHRQSPQGGPAPPHGLDRCGGPAVVDLVVVHPHDDPVELADPRHRPLSYEQTGTLPAWSCPALHVCPKKRILRRAGGGRSVLPPTSASESASSCKSGTRSRRGS